MANTQTLEYSKELQEIFAATDTSPWHHHTKIALDWFLSYLEKDTWETRKKNVVKYFREQEDNTYKNFDQAMKSMEEPKNRVAFHEDWVAWYLFLVECLHERPLVSELAQSARVFPFFAAVGRHIELAKKIVGIDEKLSEFLNGKINQPDSTLFELVVAIMYARNGYRVEFIPETALNKTPDLKVTKGEESFFVECKRLSKVTEYSENERREWRQRWLNLVPILTQSRQNIFLDVLFKVEVKDTDEYILAKIFNEIKSNISTRKSLRIENDEIIILINRIDMKNINEHFDKYMVKWNSPQMVSLLAGSFSSSENYTHLCAPKGLVRVGPDDGVDILNIFCTGIHSGYCARWECIAEESINKKAKDIKTHLSKAVRQVPDNTPTIVHISYETLHGPVVEIERARKIAESINNFDCHEKDVKAIYCHAIQPSISAEDWEIAETTMRFGKNGNDPLSILSHDMLLDEIDTRISQNTHWNEDFEMLLKQ
ncbi:hypothetical protein [Escherichia coli]|uniref:hypothetical protein n=1 Tax=Escherichia coli TaxID=562 RepID=UPI0004D878F2|nr:hypothetical protein [Escherichia coli]EEZ9024441.1 hypothetical protein [Escherichia coli O136]EFW0662581.1 hypothetical protein [Shigella dysenteriae]EAC1482973.1 hypothetical protein [Escherichia coli]EER1878827.1 hypothetical protein [Escherichia coli]EES4587321.1 hypothetical protein [Escherichia coli]